MPAEYVLILVLIQEKKTDKTLKLKYEIGLKLSTLLASQKGRIDNIQISHDTH